MMRPFPDLGDLTITGALTTPTPRANHRRGGRHPITERGGRMDDKRGESAMEDRKKEGYF